MKWVLFLPLILASTTAEVEDGPRKPKLFYVSTLSTTSTVSTLTVCYVTSATLATCSSGKRRKRRIEPDEPAGAILPTAHSNDQLWDEDAKEEDDLLLEGE